MYRTCTAHAPYWHLWPVMVYNIYQHSHKRRDFQKINLLNTKRVFWFSLKLLSETFLILRSNEWDMVRNVYGSSCKVGVILVRFEWNLNFLNIFSKSIQIPIPWQTVQGGVELFHSDRRTDRNDEANSYFSKFCKSEVWTNFKILLSPLFYCIIIFRFHSPLSTDLIYFPGRFPKRIFVTITWIFHFILNSANSTSYSQLNSFLPSCMNKVKIIPYPSSGYDTRRKQVRPLQYTHTHTNAHIREVLLSMFSAWTGNAIWLIRVHVTSTGRLLSPEKGLSTMETNWRKEKKVEWS